MFKACFAKMNMNCGAAMDASACACSHSTDMALLLTLDTVIAVSIFVIAELISSLSLISVIILEKFTGRPKLALTQ